MRQYVFALVAFASLLATHPAVASEEDAVLGSWAGSESFGGQSLSGLAAKTGRLRWRFATQGALIGRPTVDGDDVYVLSDDGGLYKLERRSGKLVWRFDTHGNAPRDLPSNTSATYDYLASA